jgi:hypothetical protein
VLQARNSSSSSSSSSLGMLTQLQQHHMKAHMLHLQQVVRGVVQDNQQQVIGKAVRFACMQAYYVDHTHLQLCLTCIRSGCWWII